MLLRGLWICVALGCMGWQIAVFSDLRTVALLKPVGEASLTGATFNDATLDGIKDRLDVAKEKTAAPAVLRAIAFTRARLSDVEFEATKAGEPSPVSERARAAIVRALDVWPVDPHLWTMLATDDMLRHQRQDAAAKALRLSYEVGEHEGSVAPKRSVLSMLLGSALDPVTQARVIEEFDNMARSSDSALHGMVALRIYNASPEAQPAFLERLAKAPEDSRREIYRMLVSAGLDPEVPGIVREAARPWQ